VLLLRQPLLLLLVLLLRQPLLLLLLLHHRVRAVAPISFQCIPQLLSRI
jgi:hypothetical protein